VFKLMPTRPNLTLMFLCLTLPYLSCCFSALLPYLTCCCSRHCPCPPHLFRHSFAHIHICPYPHILKCPYPHIPIPSYAHTLISSCPHMPNNSYAHTPTSAYAPILTCILPHIPISPPALTLTCPWLICSRSRPCRGSSSTTTSTHSPKQSPLWHMRTLCMAQHMPDQSAPACGSRPSPPSDRPWHGGGK
jgi:hypothetical protein